jgi:hypothetical protein
VYFEPKFAGFFLNTGLFPKTKGLEKPGKRENRPFIKKHKESIKKSIFRH